MAKIFSFSHFNVFLFFLRFYDRAQLDSLEEKQLPARSLKIMAEAFAIKALCYEKVTANRGTSKAKVAEREANIVRCYEVAGDLTLLFLQVSRAFYTGQTHHKLGFLHFLYPFR